MEIKGTQCFALATSLHSPRTRAGSPTKAQHCVPLISTIRWHPFLIPLTNNLLTSNCSPPSGIPEQKKHVICIQQQKFHIKTDALASYPAHWLSKSLTDIENGNCDWHSPGFIPSLHVKVRTFLRYKTWLYMAIHRTNDVDIFSVDALI